MRPPEWIQCAFNLSVPEWRKSKNQHLTRGSLDLVVFCRFLSGDYSNCWGSLGASLDRCPIPDEGFSAFMHAFFLSIFFFLVFCMLVLFWNLQDPKIVARNHKSRVKESWVRCALCTKACCAFWTKEQCLRCKKNFKKWDRVDIVFCTVLRCCSICSSNNCGNCWTALWLWSLQCSSCVPLTSSGEMELVCYGSIVSQRQMGSIKNLIKSSCNQPVCVWG